MFHARAHVCLVVYMYVYMYYMYVYMYLYIVHNCSKGLVNSDNGLMVRDSFPSLAVFSVLSDNVKSVSSQSIFALVLHIQAETAKLNHNLSGLMPNLNIIPLCALYMHVHVVHVVHVHYM